MSDPRATGLAFQADWKRLRGKAPPLAFLLRDEGVPWIRFHALPCSKRYAETPAEYETIRLRANSLAEATLGDGAECWLVICAYPSMETPIELGGEPVVPLLSFSLDDDAGRWTAVGCQTQWHRARFDRLLTSIADEKVRHVFWMKRENGTIFAPYDGGFDLFPATDDMVGQLGQSYQDWLSDHPEGL